ncbi:type II toxin-antitoxin system RelE/ParE family toxin [Actinoallomurus purpureus]|uniref:type II toxin-antitoxin system RelE/ParE family toxin n=1 Tax=Actinoallomurus purpureus TaxID=478114 RepID=UPI002093B570|nr:type II toxin-antitoxin system RelE/ParE family toxin [Actinoallomurus purpureus]MCO6006103.1 type II toxin-antitoxin system RelE/ParE family toxin [Actinoallomurus purpureus]
MEERTSDWDIYLVNEVRNWLEGIRTEDPVTFDLIEDAIYALSRSGPALKRPLVGSIAGSTIKNLKELRPGSAGRSEIRILFVFDPWRSAILLVAGDKSGNWRRWYRQAIPLAEERYDIYLKERAEEL